MDTAVMVLLLLVALPAVTALPWRQEQQRRERLTEVAEARNWSYTQRDDGLAEELEGRFPLFAGGTGRRCDDVMRAAAPSGRPCLLFDYREKPRSPGTGGGLGGGALGRPSRYAIAVTELPRALPELRLVPESFLSRLVHSLGYERMELDQVLFNQRFRVKGEREHVLAMLHPEMIDFLLAQDFDSWEIVGDLLMVTKDGRWGMADYDRVMARMDGFCDLVPAEVWQRAAEQQV